MSPAVLYGILWIWIADPSPSGLLNQITATLGLAPINLRNDFPLFLVILANGIVGASFAMVILTSAIRSIPSHLANAARVDGASEWGVLRHVVAPALSQPIRFITIYQALSLMTTYEYILLITGGGRFTIPPLCALYLSPRFRKWRLCLWRSTGARPDGDRRRRNLGSMARYQYALHLCRSQDRGAVMSLSHPATSADWKRLESRGFANRAGFLTAIILS